jgi:predicted kinase
MNSLLILIDGPKGSGKSTLSEFLKRKLSNTEFLSLDAERKLLTRTDSRDDDNRRAFQVIIKKLINTFQQKRNAVIDMGISEERVQELEKITNQHAVQMQKFSLIAPYDVLHSRVKERDTARGKVFEKNRFEYTLQVNQSKSFTGFTILDSDRLSPQDMCDKVMETIGLNSSE